MAPRAASSLPPPADVPASSASAACDPVLDWLEACRSEPSLLDGPLGRLIKDDLSYSVLKDGPHRTLTIFAHGIRDKDVDDEVIALFKQHPNVAVIPNLPD